MLRELRVRNFAIIDSAEVPFEPGFNVLTGETGAGKSLLIDAILLVRGARAQVDVIRADAELATVEAVFEIPAGGAVWAMLGEAGIGAGEDGQLVIRRDVARSGRHRAFVNDTAVTVAWLDRLGDHLVEVHGQHEHQRLLDPVHQLDVLDRFAGAETLRARVSDLFTRHRAAREAVEHSRAAERDRAQREDLLRFQVSEIEAAHVRPGEEEELRAELRRLKNVERVSAGIAEVEALLVEDGQAVVGRVARVTHVLSALARVDSTFTEAVKHLEAAAVEIDETVRSVRALRGELTFDPQRLQVIDDRLDALVRLRRKYGASEAAILEHRGAAVEELARLARQDEIVASAERDRAGLEAELVAEAGALSERRRSAAERLAARVQRELRGLGMERAVFAAAVEPVEAMGPRGMERLEFRLSANPGEEPKPLARVASGGELSRTMLALLTVVASADPVATMVFDEVDAGIGARVAGVVADRLAGVAAARQVLCVTHLAPIAARAAHHVRIDKSTRGGRTRATAAVLDGAQRVEEVARMLAGDDGSTAALRHARELLGTRRGRPA
jgi:DNA repair protein RecN (Recombination protein N)